MERKIIQFLTSRRFEAYFVWRARARDEQVAPDDPPRDPCPTHVPFLKFRHAPQVAGNVWLRGGGHEKTINHARKSPATGIKPRPVKRNAIGNHFAGQIPGEGGGGAAVGRIHFLGSEYAIGF